MKTNATQTKEMTMTATQRRLTDADRLDAITAFADHTGYDADGCEVLYYCDENGQSWWQVVDAEGRGDGTGEWYPVPQTQGDETMSMLKTGNGISVEVIEGTIRDVKPDGYGMRDESWFVAQCPDGRWVAISDAADQHPEYFDTEADVEDYWDDAAEAEDQERARLGK